jgi:peptidoglycan/LPS O-acetylase OafA/YrhL
VTTSADKRVKSISLSRELPKRARGYIPTLDGWRTVAIILVIFAHAGVHHAGWMSTRWLAVHGEIGVDIFFAISGILICTRLLAEETRNGTLSLRNFYIRRLFRIQPAALVYLLTLLGVSVLWRPIVRPREWLSSLLMFRNYTSLIGPHSDFFTAHFWSLAVEEHFYLLLPGFLLLAPRRVRILLLGCVAGLVIANRALQYHLRPGGILYHHTDIRLDALVIPALIAIMLHEGHFGSWIVVIAKRLWGAFAIVLILVTIWIPSNSFWHATAFSLLMPFVILGTVLAPENSHLFRVLESSPLRLVGRVSYSLYLWQMLFFTSGSYRNVPQFGRLDAWPFNVLAVTIAALASYYLVEKPFIRMGHRLTSHNVATERVYFSAS